MLIHWRSTWNSLSKSQKKRFTSVYWIPSHWCLIADPTEGNNVFAIYAAYLSVKARNGYENKHLLLTLVRDETGHSDSQQMENIKYGLSLFGKSLSNVVAFIAGICVANRAMFCIANCNSSDVAVIVIIKQLRILPRRTRTLCRNSRRQCHLFIFLSADGNWER